MARRSSGIAVAAGPVWTNLFLADEAGGADGPAFASALVGCAAGSAVPIEYRRAGDPAGQSAELAPGDLAPVAGANPRITRVEARGVGGAGVATFEVVKD